MRKRDLLAWLIFIIIILLCILSYLPRDPRTIYPTRVIIVDSFKGMGAMEGVVTGYYLCDEPGPDYYSEKNLQEWDCEHTGWVDLGTECLAIKVKGADLAYYNLDCGPVKGWLPVAAVEVIGSK